MRGIAGGISAFELRKFFENYFGARFAIYTPPHIGIDKNRVLFYSPRSSIVVELIERRANIYSLDSSLSGSVMHDKLLNELKNGKNSESYGIFELGRLISEFELAIYSKFDKNDLLYYIKKINDKCNELSIISSNFQKISELVVDSGSNSEAIQSYANHFEKEIKSILN